MGRFETDIVVANDRGRVAVVEIKNAHDLSPERATALRKSILTNGLPTPTFFLVVSQDQGYLWKPREDGSTDNVPPDVIFSMHDVLESYYASPILDQWLRESELRTLVFHWISDLTTRTEANNDPSIQPLEQAGFVSAIRGAATTMARAA